MAINEYKEHWNSLSDEDKSWVIKKFCENLGLGKDFDYSKVRDLHERVYGEYLKTNNSFEPFEHPVLVLELVDPIMADMILSWLNTRIELPNGTRMEVPFLGYRLMELVFDKSSLMNFTTEERGIIGAAINILKNKGV